MPKFRVIEGELVECVYECWVKTPTGHLSQDSVGAQFAKLADIEAVNTWVADMLPRMAKHDHMHIVMHHSDEYSEAEQRNQPNDIFPIS